MEQTRVLAGGDMTVCQLLWYREKIEPLLLLYKEESAVTG